MPLDQVIVIILIISSRSVAPLIGEQCDSEQQQQPEQQQQQRLPSDLWVSEHEQPISRGNPDGIHHDNDHCHACRGSCRCSCRQVTLFVSVGVGVNVDFGVLSSDHLQASPRRHYYA